MEVNLATESIKFMVLGMGTVFSFLILMIIAMNIQSKIIHRFFPDKPNAEKSTKKASKGVSKNKVAAIMGAIIHHNQYKA